MKQKKQRNRVISLTLIVALLMTMVVTPGAFATLPTSSISNSSVYELVKDYDLGTTIVNISNEKEVVGTLNIKELKDAFPKLIRVNANNTNITDIVSDSRVTNIGSSDTFADGSKQIIAHSGYVIDYNKVNSSNDISIDDLFADLLVSNSSNSNDTTTPGDVVESISVTLDGSPVTLTGTSTYGNIDYATYLQNLSIGHHPLVLTLNFKNTTSYSESITYTLNIQDEQLNLVSDKSSVTQGSTFQLTASKTGANGLPALLDKDKVTVNINPGLATNSDYQIIQNGNELKINFQLDINESPGNYQISLDDSVSNKSAIVSINVTALPPVNSLEMKEYNTAGSSVDYNGQTMFIKGGTSVSSLDSDKITGANGVTPYTTTTYYLLYDGSTPVAVEQAPLFSVVDNVYGSSYGSVTGEVVEINGQAALKIIGPAVDSSTNGTFDLLYNNSTMLTVDYTLVPSNAPIRYLIYAVDGAIPGGQNADWQSLINSQSSEVTLVAEYEDNSGWNAVSSNTAYVKEQMSIFLVATAQYEDGTPQFVIPFNNMTGWYENYGSMVQFSTTGNAFEEAPSLEGTAYGVTSTVVLKVDAALEGAGEKANKVLAQISDGSLSNTLYFQIEILPRTLDRYEFRNPNGTPLITGDTEIPIGTSKNFTVYAIYDNGFSEQVTNLQDLAFAFNHSNLFEALPSLGNLLEIKATSNGGKDDSKQGSSAELTATDQKGAQGSVTLSLAYSLIKGLTHYVETPAGILSYEDGTELKAISDKNSLANNTLEIPRGLTAKVWVVPTFTNEDMYDPSATNNEWQKYGVTNNATFSSSGSHLSQPAYDNNDNAHLLNTNDSNSTTLATAVDIGDVFTNSFTVDTALSFDGHSHALLNPLTSVQTSLGVKITAPVVTNMDVERYDPQNQIYTTVYNSGNYNISGKVGDQVIIRVKTVYSDGYAVDQLGANSSDTFADGVYFLPLNNPDPTDPDGYLPANGPTDPATAGSPNNFGLLDNTHLSVLYGNFMSFNPKAYYARVNPTPSGPSKNDWNNNQTASSLHATLAALTQEINIHSQNENAVKADFYKVNGDLIPGHYVLTLQQKGDYTFDFSGTYNANGYANEPTIIKGISSTQNLVVNVNVTPPDAEKIYLVSDTLAYISTSPSGQDLYEFDKTNDIAAGTKSIFNVYPLILDSSYRLNSDFKGKLPDRLFGTSATNTLGINYLHKNDWTYLNNGSAIAEAIGRWVSVLNTDLAITQKADSKGNIYLECEIIGALPSSNPATIQLKDFKTESVYYNSDPNYTAPSIIALGDPADMLIYTITDPIVQDIYVTSTGSTQNNPSTNSVEASKNIIYGVEYIVSGSQGHRTLLPGEEPFSGWNPLTQPNERTPLINELVVTPDSSNPDKDLIPTWTGSQLNFQPLLVGHYKFTLSTTNGKNHIIPTLGQGGQGERVIEFDVGPITTYATVYYGENITLPQLPLSAASYVDAKNLLNPTQLANGRLQMLYNNDDTTTIDVKDASEEVVARVIVTLIHCDESWSLAPVELTNAMQFYTFADGQQVKLQWAKTYTKPGTGTVTSVEYEDATSMTLVPGGWDDFLTLDNGTLTASNPSGNKTDLSTSYTVAPPAGVTPSNNTIYGDLLVSSTSPNYTYSLKINGADVTNGNVDLNVGSDLSVEVLVSVNDANPIPVPGYLTVENQIGTGFVTVINHGDNLATIIGTKEGSTRVVFTPLNSTKTVHLNINVKEAALFTISGTVTDADTKQPIQNASVTLQDASGSPLATVSTGVNGNYAFSGNIPAGTYHVSASRTGYTSKAYANQVVVGPDQTGINIELTPIATPANPQATLVINPNVIVINQKTIATAGGLNFPFNPLIFSDWTIDDPSIASLTVLPSGYQAELIGLSLGTTKVHVMVTDGKTPKVPAEATITVNTTGSVGGPGITLQLSPSSIVIGNNSSATTSINRFTNPANLVYTWNSDTPAIATVTGDTPGTATVTGVANGSAKITVTATDSAADESATASATITVTSSSGGSPGGGGGSSSYTVRYNANGGTGSKSVSVSSGSNHTVLSDADAGITNENIAFQGWNTQASGDGTAYKAGDVIKVSSSITLYAQWQTSGTTSETDPKDSTTGNTIEEMFTDEHIAYVNGYPDDTFKPSRNITRAEAAAIFYRLLRNQGTVTSGQYKDVSVNAWYGPAVNYLSSINIINGYPDGTFLPDQAISRAEFAAMAARFDPLATNTTNAFSDLTNHWSVSFINSAAAKGWMNGYPDGTFKPNNKITRAEVVSTVNNMLGRTADQAYIAANLNSLTVFSDLISDNWAYYPILEATNAHEFSKDSGEEVWLN